MPIVVVPPREGRSKNYRIRGTYLGVHVDESTGSHRRSLAEAHRRRREREIEGGVSGSRPTGTFSGAVIEYLKGCPDSEVPYVEKLLGHFEDTPLADFDQAMIDAAVDELYPDRAPATVNRNCLAPLAAILHRAAELRLMPYLRVRKRKEPPGRVRWIEPAQAEAMIAACADRLRPLAVFLLSTGARITEAVRLDWDDVDLVRRHVVLRDTKNGETYGVHLGERVFLELANMGGDRKGRVFGYRDRHDVYPDWRAACKGAGIRDFTPHDCRHTYATWLRQSGRGALELMELGRWKDIKSVKRYAHVASDEQRDAIADLPINPRLATRGKSVESGDD